MYNYKVERLLNNLDKAYKGPVIPMKEWDTKIIPKTIKGILKKYNLNKTLDLDNPINCDDELADTFFKAGWELALELGLYCEDTERVIKVTEDEILECMRDYQECNILGEGQDQVIMKPRKPEDPYPPLLAASLGIVCSEENYLPLVQGIVKYNKLVDVLHGPTLATVFGREIRSGTPYETLMGNYESELKKEALWRAGRPGMPCTGVAGAVTEYGHMGGAPAVAGRGNVTMSLCPVELKCTFSNFHRIIQGLNYGHKLRIGGFSYIGGYAGPPEGAALACIANDLLIPTILQSDYTSSYVYDIQLFGNCGRKAVWANSVSCQAVSRNTGFMRNKIVNETGGPCTEMFMYEAAVGLMNHCVSGASKTTQPRSAGGRYTDYITPMEAWWCGDVFKSCAGMTRKQANEIAKKILPKYEAKLGVAPDKGLPVQECFDLKNQVPFENYRELYTRVRNELIDIGMPLDKCYGDWYMEKMQARRQYSVK
ncbi:MAG: monomethylamine:corrinoid methyltransferase [Clostridiales bacterium]|nr:monomethylamine:corrinoid methyltransferase [Clostridiales bacterium]MDY3747932.1 monomethylamine:corrinoid methyltransferase [Lachnospiraceae bacterium]